MYTYGIYIKEANFTPDLASVLYAKVEVWNIRKQAPENYEFWVNLNDDGGSSVKQNVDGEYKFIFRGDYSDCCRWIEKILSVTQSNWDYGRFKCYVAGWCDAMRKVEAKNG